MAKILSETNAHTADCIRQAADHLKEAITLLLCSNADDIEPDVDVLRPIVRRLEAKATEERWLSSSG